MKEKQQAVKRKLEDDDDVDMSHFMDDGPDVFLVERSSFRTVWESIVQSQSHVSTLKTARFKGSSKERAIFRHV